MNEQLYKNANPNATDNVAQAAGAEEANAGTDANANSDGTVYDADYKVEDDNK